MEQGNIQQAQNEYAQAVKFHPQAALLQVDWAQAALENNPTPDDLKKIITTLNRSVQNRPSAMGWRLLSQAYSQLGQQAYADYAAAEHSLRIGEPLVALRQVDAALRASPSEKLTLKLEDLQQRIKNLYPNLNKPRR